MRWQVVFACVALAACSKSEPAREIAASGAPAQSARTYDIAEPPAPSAVARAQGAGASSDSNGGSATTPITVSVPQVAYVYKYDFRLDGDTIAKAQQAHVALCDRLGPLRCQVLAMTSASGESGDGNTLKLRVASNLARAFGGQLRAAVGKAGGRTVSESIDAEDVSKDIVDTEARLRQRTLLVERLTQILRTRQGKVSELVEAERSVAAAQEEIDQANSWLTELRGRVAMSTFELSYSPVAADPGNPRSGLSESIDQSWTGFVIVLGVLGRLLIYLAPWLVLIAIGAFGWRQWRRRRAAAVEGTQPAAE